MILKRAFHMMSQSHEKGVHMMHMQNALQSWQLMDLPHKYVQNRVPDFPMQTPMYLKMKMAKVLQTCITWWKCSTPRH